MKYLSIMGCILLASCTRDHAEPARSAAHNEAIVRGSLAPAAPVQLTYQIPADITANRPTTIDVAINTRLDQGSMTVEVAGHEGATMLGASQYRFDLAATSARPIALQLRVLPADQAERFLAVLVTVNTEMGPLARSFRIDLNPTSITPLPESRMPAGAVIQQ